MTYTHASLFSGIGGAELAASWLGWTNVFHCEIQEFQRKVLEYWFPNSVSYEDITKTDFSEWRGHIDVLTGGFPCQPFSVAGKRKGAEDNRYLWREMLRAIRQIQPTWIVGENVNGILSMVQPGKETKMGRTDDLFDENFIYRKEQKFTIETICEDLESAGYSSNRLLFQLVPSEHPTEETGCGLLQDLMPTPIASDAQGGAAKLTKGRRLRNGKVFSATLKDLAASKMLPTPQTQGLKVCNKDGKTEFLNLDLLLTPSASDGLRAGMNMESLKSHKKKYAEQSNLAEQIAHKVGGGTSQLNPLFVTEMMGYPLEWLTLPFLSQSGEEKVLKR